MAFAGQITLMNATGGPVEIRAVRAGVVKIEPGATKVFLNQAEDGDFRVWTAADKCNHIFFYETSDDARLVVIDGPVLYRLAPGADRVINLTALRTDPQPAGWPMKAERKECD